MREFSLTITLGNDAMTKHSDIANVLSDVQSDLNNLYDKGVVRDDNGNCVGQWVITKETNDHA